MMLDLVIMLWLWFCIFQKGNQNYRDITAICCNYGWPYAICCNFGYSINPILQFVAISLLQFVAVLVNPMQFVAISLLQFVAIMDDPMQFVAILVTALILYCNLLQFHYCNLLQLWLTLCNLLQFSYSIGERRFIVTFAICCNFSWKWGNTCGNAALRILCFTAICCSFNLQFVAIFFSFNFVLVMHALDHLGIDHCSLFWERLSYEFAVQTDDRIGWPIWNFEILIL